MTPPPINPERIAREGLLRRQLGERIQSASGLRVGDVVQVAVELTDRKTQMPFWWRTFRVVVGLPTKGSGPTASTSPHLNTLILKMHPDPDKDEREIDMRKDVVTFLPEASWPQGVIGMHMKLVATGRIKLGD